MKLSIIIPCYNEKYTIRILVKTVLNSPIKNKEIIVVDDGSTDGTKEILDNEFESVVDKIIYHQRNSGKGAAVRSGLSAVTGDLVIIQDADLEYKPSEYPRLMKPILDGEADVVYGSRFLSTESRRASFFWHMVGNKILTLLTNMVCNITLTDMETCYKMFKSDVIKNMKLEENHFGFEPEVTIKASQMNCRIYEVGISYFGRGYELGKKVNWKDGFGALACIIKYGIIRKFFNQEPFLEKFLRRVRLRKILPFIAFGQTVCDIGCGQDFALLRSISNTVYKSIGIDKKVPQINYSNIQVKTIELSDKIPLEDESVDMVTLLAALEHFDRDDKIIQEAKRILKDGGLLLITVPSKKAKFIIQFLANQLHLISKEQIRGHKRYYSVNELKRLLISCGFIDPKIKPFQLGLNLFCSAKR